jgi:hypothetical protein
MEKPSSRDFVDLESLVVQAVSLLGNRRALPAF